jgi:subtilase family serine protease
MQMIAVFVLVAALLTAESPGQARPDLIITDVWLEDGKVHYQVMNIGSERCDARFGVELSLAGTSIEVDAVTEMLAPDQRLNRYFPKSEYRCNGTSQSVRVEADVHGTVLELDETNNTLSEHWLCDQEPPTITQGPQVLSVGMTIARVVWGTNEDCDSAVLYDEQSGTFGQCAEQMGSARTRP